MSKRLQKPHQRRHVVIYDDDWEFLGEWAQANGIGHTPGMCVRAIVHRHVDLMKAKATAEADSQQVEAKALLQDLIEIGQTAGG